MASSKKTGPSQDKSKTVDSGAKGTAGVKKTDVADPKPGVSSDPTEAKPEAATPQPAKSAAAKTVAAAKEKTANDPKIGADPKKPDASKATETKADVEKAKAQVEKPEVTKAEPEKPKPQDTATPKPVASVPSAQVVKEEKKSTFLPLVLGGIVAGAIGFLAAEMDVFSSGSVDETDALRAELSTQQDRLAALESAEPPVVEVPEVDLSPLETQLAGLDDRITALEKRPARVAPEGVDSEAADAYAEELAALKAEADAQRTEIEALINNAKTVEQATADAAKAAGVQAAVAKIVSAIDAGRPFEDAVSDLQALDIGEIDPALTAVAPEGVATLSALQAEFPDQARTALAEARANGVQEGQQGLGGFLKRSLGARSVAPREGNDPDAVLSRAEAALTTGDLTTTLAEIDTLPEEAQAAIADWRTSADARVSARAAADALAQRLTAD